VIASTRAFLIAGLVALPCAALLHLLVALGMSDAWAAMVHLILFGWITLMIVAVNYHTLPVFSARDFPHPRLIWAHWALGSAGVALASGGLLAGWNAGATAGLLLELGGALVFVANTILLFLRGVRRPQRAPSPPIAGQPLVDRAGTRATMAAGISLPLAQLALLAVRLGWLGGAWVLAAEHLATLGWVMLMIVGVAYHVLPRFSGQATRGPAWARAQMVCHGGALALIVLALGFGWARVFAIGGLLMALAIGLFAWTVWPTLCAIVSHASPIALIFKERPR
jgi:cbb3-type cytochrome oxidase subunit 1